MKSTDVAPNHSLAPITNPDFGDDEADYYKGLYEPTGSALRLLEVETAFVRGGYMIRRIEISPHDPPVAVLRMISRAAPRFSDRAEFARHVSQILESVNVRVAEADLVAEQNSSGALIAFLWQRSTPGSRESMDLERLLDLLP